MESNSVNFVKSQKHFQPTLIRALNIIFLLFIVCQLLTVCCRSVVFYPSCPLLHHFVKAADATVSTNRAWCLHKKTLVYQSIYLACSLQSQSFLHPSIFIPFQIEMTVLCGACICIWCKTENVNTFKSSKNVNFYFVNWIFKLVIETIYFFSFLY